VDGKYSGLDVLGFLLPLIRRIDARGGWSTPHSPTKLSQHPQGTGFPGVLAKFLACPSSFLKSGIAAAMKFDSKDGFGKGAGELGRLEGQLSKQQHLLLRARRGLSSPVAPELNSMLISWV